IAGILAGARLYIGNDSGITHLAAAVGCPTVAVFGPTDPTVWAPRGARVHVVAGDPWPDAEAVLRDARAVLA
ncbi:MAG TPA: glycosyltransferase family 9 protein, partial [Candidatus Hydrogenedentes bacterium]|nr:glycosyltransferase family 9 protein [Candidatus Hydrogenedentota bacterium]